MCVVVGRAFPLRHKKGCDIQKSKLLPADRSESEYQNVISYQCFICGLRDINGDDVRNHIEDLHIHESLSDAVSCEICESDVLSVYDHICDKHVSIRRFRTSFLQSKLDLKAAGGAKIFAKKSVPVGSFHQAENDEQAIEEHMSPTLPSPNSPNQVIFPPPPEPVQEDANSYPHPLSLAPPQTIDLPWAPPSLSEAEIISLLTSLSSLLEQESSTPSLLESGLLKLASVPVTVPALLSTGVGKVVRRLKDREGKVGRLAGKLVSRWKRIALQYEPQPSTGVDQTVSDKVTEEPVAAHVEDGEDVKEVVLSCEGGSLKTGVEESVDNEDENLNDDDIEVTYSPTQSKLQFCAPQ